MIFGVFLQEHTKENITDGQPRSAVYRVPRGDGVNLIRESVRLVLRELIEVEARKTIRGAPMHAPRPARTDPGPGDVVDGIPMPPSPMSDIGKVFMTRR